MAGAGDHHLLLYAYVEDVAERRSPYRESHLARIGSERERGHIVMAGAIGDPPNGAAFVFKGLDPDQIEEFIRGDPYVEAGLVTSWRIEPLKLV
jgi:uncharacterized protein YciI